MNNYIYKVTDKVTGCFYIGSQCQGKIIGVNYFTSSRNKEFRNKFKTDPSQFEIKIIGVFADAEACVLQENIFIKDNIKNHFCINRHYVIGGKIQFSRTDIKQSQETRRKISLASKGKCLSEETKRKMDEARRNMTKEERKNISDKISKGNKGKKRSEEFKRKISEVHKGKIVSEETRLKISLSNKGKKHGCKGYVPSEEARLKISKGNKGKKRSEETRRKMALAKTGHPSPVKGMVLETLRKKVICVETQIIYDCITNAAKAVNTDIGNIGRCANHKRKTAAGFHWEFIKE